MKKKMLLCASILACMLLGVVGVKALTIKVWDITYSLRPATSVVSEARTMDLAYQRVTNTPSYIATDADFTYVDVTAQKKSSLGIYQSQLNFRFYNPVVNVTDSESYYALVPGTYKYMISSYSVYIQAVAKVYNSDTQ